MSWTYKITEHVMISADGELRFSGYSGAGLTVAEGRNNLAMEGAVGKGPIPTGRYAIGAPHDSPHTGPFTLNLDPLPGTNTLGRSEFRIHGNNRVNNASHGCIILPVDARHVIWDSGDHVLEVVA